jgi:hypothetical protein
VHINVKKWMISKPALPYFHLEQVDQMPADIIVEQNFQFCSIMYMF